MNGPLRDVVVVAVSDTYSDSVRRGFYSTADQTMLSLIDSDRVGKVLVVDHPRGLLSQVLRRLRGDLPAPSSGRLRGTRPLTLRTPTPTDWPAIVRRYRSYDTQIRLAALRFGLRRPSLVTFNHFHAAVGSPWAARQVFYAQDDEAALPHRLAWQESSRRAYAEAATKATMVAVSAPLLERISPERGGMLIHNGVDPALWSSIAPPVAPPRPGRSTAVYAGTIDSRIDQPALAALVGAGYEVRMVGPCHDVAIRRDLMALGVVLVGTKSRLEVVRELVDADLCVLAHRHSALTSAMSPLKLYEYVVSGTPVVASDLGPLPPEVAAHVCMVAPGGDVVEAADRARARGRLSETTRREVLAATSWRSRHAPLIEHLTR